MYEPGVNVTVARPTMCPFCDGKVIDTLAKVVNVRTVWRCRTCDETWTIGSLASRSERNYRL
jgi:ribosomal protein L37AE/L43A